jgi:hypothetical protein
VFSPRKGDRQKRLIEWVKPDGGALCCLRLSPEAFDDARVARFWLALPEAQLQIGDGAWFGESSAVLRLGFGCLPIDVLSDALSALSMLVEAAAPPSRRSRCRQSAADDRRAVSQENSSGTHGVRF